ncbi:hypothetical protein P168DRAFT_326293 [Aspergillus campestris IBT 28561]|uniref:Uncharacterized protein n=1 Tax=Aspergillus campestris (strain IBT 28561) TaxID=1392248 RepID=A0A2I1D7Z1_ASPC2|nr:uncharacterized protein P168DRAFT_326293 [Aspergillus campestris IBT 28561]PKY05999.1 hypothetical protein P168DRAFT_326293 [Aspergillus campestris IBT 28561]
MVGKRKRDTSVVSRSTTKEEEDAPPAVADTSAHDVFRKFFEAQFEPIEAPEEAVDEESDEAEETGSDGEGSDFESGSEWSGVSGEGEESEVEVIEHRDASSSEHLASKKARKAFMSSKLPSLAEKPTAVKRAPTKEKEDDDPKEADNLKHDLALQRLLKESHLLEDASDLAPTGKNRLKALDLRMQELGAKSSLYHQKMPSAHRRGIKAKAETKEDKRRRDARENGIILEKPAHKKNKSSSGHRERGVGGPSVGKFAGGTLNLSKSDIFSVKGKALAGRKKPSRGKPKGRR